MTGGLAILISIALALMTFVAIPALQRSQRDVARKNDISAILTEIESYKTDNRGKLPSASDLSTADLI